MRTLAALGMRGREKSVLDGRTYRSNNDARRLETRMVLWWIANLLGLLVVIPLVIFLANGLIREAIAAKRYGEEILVHGVGITGNLDPVPALAETAQLSSQVKAAAVAYLTALKPLLPPSSRRKAEAGEPAVPRT